MKTLGELLTPDERAAVRAPIEKARTLPRRAFVDKDFHAFEVEHALKESWFAVTFATELPDAGDMLPLAVLGIPVLLVRDRNGIARAFHNVCPYDGCEVSIGPQRGVETIVTPYHGWNYGLDGRLLEANYFDGTPSASEIALDSLNADLVPIPCEEWMSTGVPPKLIIFNGVLGGARAPHCQERRLQRDRFATTMTILNRSDCFGAARAGSEWPARHAHSSACPERLSRSVTKVLHVASTTPEPMGNPCSFASA